MTGGFPFYVWGICSRRAEGGAMRWERNVEVEVEDIGAVGGIRLKGKREKYHRSQSPVILQAWLLDGKGACSC